MRSSLLLFISSSNKDSSGEDEDGLAEGFFVLLLFCLFFIFSFATSINVAEEFLSPPKMYGSQSSGPPQPEWRLASSNTQQSASSRHHPPQQPSWRASSPPPPPPPPRPTTTSSSTYNPTIYGQISNPPSAVNVHPGTSISPVSAVAGSDTTSWGVKYNRHQLHAQSPPPLPVSVVERFIDLTLMGSQYSDEHKPISRGLQARRNHHRRSLQL